MSNDDWVKKDTAEMTDGDSGAHPALKSAQERFPNHREALTRLFGEDDEFRGLCDDYRDCLAYLERTRDSVHASTALRKEFSTLQLRLEIELLQYIEKAEAKPFSSAASNGKHEAKT